MTTLKHEVEREAFEAHIKTTAWYQVLSKAKDDDDDGASTFRMARMAAQAAWDARASYKDKGWRPIESAPRDASAFLAYRSGQVATASCLVREDGEMWSFGNQSGHRDVFPELVPTHWQPLPAAPSSHDGEDQ